MGVQQEGVYSIYSTGKPTKIAARSIGMNMSQNTVFKMKDDQTVRAFVNPLFFFRAGHSLDLRGLTQQ